MLTLENDGKNPVSDGTSPTVIVTVCLPYTHCLLPLLCVYSRVCDGKESSCATIFLETKPRLQCLIEYLNPQLEAPTGPPTFLANDGLMVTVLHDRNMKDQLGVLS